MRTINLKISDLDFNKYNLQEQELTFSQLVEKIKLEYAKEALYECNKTAKRYSISDLTMNDINAEIKAVRDAKNNY